MQKQWIIDVDPAGYGVGYPKRFTLRPYNGGLDFMMEKWAGKQHGVVGGTIAINDALALADALYEAAEQAPRAHKARPHGPQEYKGNGKHLPERVDPTTTRLRVPGGWLYRTHGDTTGSGGTQGVVSVVYVQMPEVVGYDI